MILLKDWKIKPKQWGPFSNVLASVFRNAEALGIDPKTIVAFAPFWEGAGNPRLWTREKGVLAPTYCAGHTWLTTGLRLTERLVYPNVYSLQTNEVWAYMGVRTKWMVSGNTGLNKLLRGFTGDQYDAVDTNQNSATCYMGSYLIDVVGESSSLGWTTPSYYRHPQTLPMSFQFNCNTGLQRWVYNHFLMSEASILSGSFRTGQTNALTINSTEAGANNQNVTFDFNILLIFDRVPNRETTLKLHEQPFFLLQANGAPVFFDLAPPDIATNAEPGTISVLGYDATGVESGVSAPTLIAPADTLTNVTQPVTFSWNAVSGATDYNIQIDVLITFDSGNGIDETTGGATTYETSSLLANTEYFWRVRAAA